MIPIFFCSDIYIAFSRSVIYIRIGKTKFLGRGRVCDQRIKPFRDSRLGLEYETDLLKVDQINFRHFIRLSVFNTVFAVYTD